LIYLFIIQVQFISITLRQANIDRCSAIDTTLNSYRSFKIT